MLAPAPVRSGDTVRVFVGTNRCRFLTPYPRAIVDDVTSCWKKNYIFMPAYRSGRWDGKLHLLTPAGTFPTGLLHDVVEVLTKNGLRVETEVPADSQPLPVVHGIEGAYGGLVPRDYQVEAVRRVLVAQRGILRLPTGAGKTLVAALVCDAFDAPALVLIHGQHLVDQTYEKFCQYVGSDRVGMVMAETYQLGRFIIGSIDTLASRIYVKDPPVIALVKERRVVIADEAHRVGGGGRTFQTVLNACPAPVRIGMSGTPITRAKDIDMRLIAQTGSLLYDVPPVALQERGDLSGARLTVYEVHEPRGMEHYSWREALTYLIAENVPRTEKIIEIALDRARKGSRVLIIGGFSVRLVRHLEQVYRRAVAGDSSAPKAAFIARSDTAAASYRPFVNKSVADLQAGRINILCSTVIFDEGTDVPDLDVIIMAAPTKSFVRLMQRIGRGLRPKEENRELEVIDFMDTTNPYLMKQFRARVRVYESEKLFSSITHHEITTPAAQQPLALDLEPYADDADDGESIS